MLIKKILINDTEKFQYIKIINQFLNIFKIK